MYGTITSIGKVVEEDSVSTQCKPLSQTFHDGMEKCHKRIICVPGEIGTGILR
jgi:hypothetical protein